jgi:hypothetical protein
MQYHHKSRMLSLSFSAILSMGTTCGFERLKLQGQQTAEGDLVAARRFRQTLRDGLLKRFKVLIVFAVETFFAY